MTASYDSYYARTASGALRHPPLEGAVEVDVCIIGGGLAGLTTAYELARQGQSVVLVEAAGVAQAASGRNGGFVSSGFAENSGRLEKMLDPVNARALYDLSCMGTSYIRERIDGMDRPDLIMGEGHLHVTRHDNEDGVRAHLARLARVFGHEAEFWPVEKVRGHLVTERYYQGWYDSSAFHIHPLNYALALAEAAEAFGARIYENTPAVDLNSGGASMTVSTPDGQVTAGQVVMCANTKVGGLHPQAGRAIQPVATFVAVTEPMGDRLTQAIRIGAAISDTRRASDYYRVVEGDRLLWGGRMTTWNARPSHLAAKLKHDILAVYPQLEGLRIESAWPGITGHAVHHMPQIGEIAPGLWIASAFGGHGLNTTAMAGVLVAAAIADGDDRWRRFAPFGLKWAGGPLGRMATQLSYWNMKANDWIDEKKCPLSA